MLYARTLIQQPKGGKRHFEGRKFTLNVEHQLVASAENICIHPPSALPKLPGMPQEINHKKEKKKNKKTKKQEWESKKKRDFGN